MLFIEQIYENANLKSDYIKCPSRKHGRLCDKPVGDRATMIALKTEGNIQTSGKIMALFISPLNCGVKFIPAYIKTQLKRKSL